MERKTKETGGGLKAKREGKGRHAKERRESRDKYQWMTRSLEKRGRRPGEDY